MNKLDRAYAMVPGFECKGLCQESCGPVIPSEAEESRILKRQGAIVDYDKKTLTCHLLTDGRCEIYADRPLLCRLFGAVKKMRCPHGCAPVNGLMTTREENRAMELVYGGKS